MLMQTDGKKIYLFPAWPRDWDVTFLLHVTSSQTIAGDFRDGKVTYRATGAELDENITVMDPQ